MLVEWYKCQANKSSVWFPDGGKGKPFTTVLIGAYDELQASDDSCAAVTNKQGDLDTHGANKAH